MSSPAGEHTSLAAHEGETQMAEKGSRKPSPNHEHQRVEVHCDHHSTTDAVMSATQNEKWRVSEEHGTRSNYGSVDTAQMSVCRSCQHLYAGNAEVVLSPSCLEGHLPRTDPSNPKPVSVHRPWAARRYEGLCDCGASVSGGLCTCPGRATQGTLHSLLSCNAPCLKKVKVVALVTAAILPWVFLVTYIVLTST